ncbi:MAG TPA: metallophosphoesterase family protein [Candidatus Polarisedimenticolia bacterium]|nr:metallophosphoesterase family protein [Candidatus Polarisedimenticolia bacterium]
MTQGKERHLGVISDTHGLLRPQVVEALRGVELILHAGDVGAPGILEDLRRIAPVIAVRGNVDVDSWARRLPETELIEVAGVSVFMLHNLAELDLDPKAAAIRVVVFGHSHRGEATMKDSVLYLNPGAAGPRRFSLPVSVARLTITGGAVHHEILTLDC